MNHDNVIIYGPAGCGKTVNGEALRKHYGMERVVEAEWHYTERSRPKTGCLVLTQDLDGLPYSGRTVPFHQAMNEAGLS